MHRPVSASMTLPEFSVPSTRIAKHSRVSSSIIFSFGAPFHLQPGNARSHMTIVQPERPFFGCVIGTLRPSRRHSLSTRLSFSISQQRSDPTIAISAILPGQLDYVRHKSVFVRATRCVAQPHTAGTRGHWPPVRRADAPIVPTPYRDGRETGGRVRAWGEGAWWRRFCSKSSVSSRKMRFQSGSLRSPLPPFKRQSGQTRCSSGIVYRSGIC
jgi:hypothetical protein